MDTRNTSIEMLWLSERDKNPSQVLPDDLVDVYHNIWQHRDANETVNFLNDLENFHLQASCIRAKYPSFNERNLVVQTEFQHLQVTTHPKTR